ncbi:hypothetical protein HYQ45_011519 [Verticillium longisporum]|uniref:Uncharacterized protein n=1 Tax=Verticillium longisporum TaxID=100787 RepID=A0A8I3AMU1_VERLO|nr:hypothetical protein HYQ45_011519 [Verticillium longisporum]
MANTSHASSSRWPAQLPADAVSEADPTAQATDLSYQCGMRSLSKAQSKDIDAMHMLQRLRSGVKVESAVRQINDSDLLLSCSGSQASNSPPPTTTHRRGRRYSDPGPVVLG